MTSIQGQFYQVLLFKYIDKLYQKAFSELRQVIAILL